MTANGQFRWAIARPLANGESEGPSDQEKTALGLIPPESPSNVFAASDPWTNDRIIRLARTTGSSSTVTGRSPTGPNRYFRGPKYDPPHDPMNSVNVQQDRPSYTRAW